MRLDPDPKTKRMKKVEIDAAFKSNSQLKNDKY